MLYEKCIKCDRLGKTCMPNIYAMPVSEAREWLKKLKEEKGWSNAHLAEMSGVPKGTIDSSFASKGGKSADVNYSTFAPVICSLIGSEILMPCKSANIDLTDLSEKINALEEKNRELKDEFEHREAEYESRIEYFKQNLSWKNRIILILMIVAFVLMAFILSELLIDFMNDELGFFWRKS